MINHLWQSTVFAVGAGLLTLALRRNRAQVRYWLWLAASMKFLVPFALLMSLGNVVPRPAAAERIAPPAVAIRIVQLAEPLPETPLPVAPRSQVPWLPMVWACGFAGVAMMRLRGWLRVRAAVGASLPVNLAAAVEVRLAPGLLEPGVVGVLRPILLLPDGIVEKLTPAQLDAVLAHELCHVRRRDNLTSAVQMLVEMLFWFHPLVWWIGARLVEERERACDEEVLRLGGDPREYADAILNVCKLYIESPLTCVAGVTGADLKKRIEAIMTNRISLNLNLGKQLLLGAAVLAAVFGPLIVGVVKAQTDAPLAFEVASVKPYVPSPGTVVGGTGGTIRISGNRVTMVGNLKGFVMSAYDVWELQVSGAPQWTDKEGRQQDYVINAKAAGEGALAMDQARRMLQTLLADRFQLKLRRETKAVPVYDLVVGKNGPKMKVSSPDTKPATDLLSASNALWRIKWSNLTMADFVNRIRSNFDRPLLDKTGLSAGYDFTLEYSRSSPDLVAPGGPDAYNTIFSAVQEQLGLKLVEAKEPVETVVIDHAERPSEN